MLNFFCSFILFYTVLYVGIIYNALYICSHLFRNLAKTYNLLRPCCKKGVAFFCIYLYSILNYCFVLLVFSLPLRHILYSLYFLIKLILYCTLSLKVVLYSISLWREHRTLLFMEIFFPFFLSLLLHSTVLFFIQL
jgi:hypothetical protein